MKPQIIPLIAFVILLFTACSKEPDGIYHSQENKFLDYSPIEIEILDLINEHRKSMGLTSLKTLNAISNIADDHTNYMIEIGEVNHDNFPKRVQTLMDIEHAKSVGENVAYGFNSAKGVVDSWIDSLGHKKIIEDPIYTHFGISIERNEDGRNYFTHIFIKK